MSTQLAGERAETAAPPFRKLRVVTLVHSLIPYGGAERLARLITMGLDPAKFDRTLCVTRPPRDRESAEQAEELRNELESAGVRVMILKRRFKLALWSWWPLVRLLRGERVDVFHSHQFGPNAWAAVLGRIARVPVVIAHEHTWSYEGKPVRRFIDRELIARCTDAFMAVSRRDRERMIEVEGIKPSHVRFLPIGIDDPPSGNGHDVRAELGIAPDQPVIGTLCALRPQKAIPVLVRSAALLAPRFPGLRVLIFGEGPQRKRLQRFVDVLGVSDVVSLVGFRGDVPDVLAAIDVAVCSSDFEGSPLSIMEYMEAGKPVVATRVGGVPDLVEDGVQGRLVERRHPEALAEAIAELLKDRGLAAEMGSRGRERRREEFRIDVLVDRLQELYQELHAAKGVSARPVMAAQPVRVPTSSR